MLNYFWQLAIVNQWSFLPGSHCSPDQSYDRLRDNELEDKATFGPHGRVCLVVGCTRVLDLRAPEQTEKEGRKVRGQPVGNLLSGRYQYLAVHASEKRDVISLRKAVRKKDRQPFYLCLTFFPDPPGRTESCDCQTDATDINTPPSG